MPRVDAAPTLETARLVLRAHRLSDFAESAAMWADPDVVRHIAGAPSTPEASWSRLLRYAGHWRLLGFGNDEHVSYAGEPALVLSRERGAALQPRR